MEKKKVISLKNSANLHENVEKSNFTQKNYPIKKVILWFIFGVPLSGIFSKKEAHLLFLILAHMRTFCPYQGVKNERHMAVSQ